MKQPSAEEVESPGVRAWINRHPIWAVVISVVVLAGWFVWRLWPDPAPRAFYTTDDGATLFTHAYVVPPFDHEGKQAVQAIVFTCDDGKTSFIGYLQRFTPEGKAGMEKKLKATPPAQRRGPMRPDPGWVEVKRPGPGEWEQQLTPQQMGQRLEAAIKRGATPQAIARLQRSYGEVVDVKCRDGKGTPVPVGAD